MALKAQVTDANADALVVRHRAVTPRNAKTRHIILLPCLGETLLRLDLQHSIAPQHAFYQITQRTPEVFSGSLLQSMLVDEQDVVLEACVEMWLKP